MCVSKCKYTGVSSEAGELLTLRGQLGSLPVLMESVFLILLGLYCVVILFISFFLALFIFVLCLVYPILPMSLDSPFLIASSVFSNVFTLCDAFSIPLLGMWYGCNIWTINQIIGILSKKWIESQKTPETGAHINLSTG